MSSATSSSRSGAGRRGNRGRPRRRLGHRALPELGPAPDIGQVDSERSLPSEVRQRRSTAKTPASRHLVRDAPRPRWSSGRTGRGDTAGHRKDPRASIQSELSHRGTVEQLNEARRLRSGMTRRCLFLTRAGVGARIVIGSESFAQMSPLLPSPSPRPRVEPRSSPPDSCQSACIQPRGRSCTKAARRCPRCTVCRRGRRSAAHRDCGSGPRGARS
jgi:hypothetical protein